MIELGPSKDLEEVQEQLSIWEDVLVGSEDVTLVNKEGQTITVSALLNLLSKAGNLGGLAAPGTALTNLGATPLGKALLGASNEAEARAALSAQQLSSVLTALSKTNNAANTLPLLTGTESTESLVISALVKALLSKSTEAEILGLLGAAGLSGNQLFGADVSAKSLTVAGGGSITKVGVQDVHVGSNGALIDSAAAEVVNASNARYDGSVWTKINDALPSSILQLSGSLLRLYRSVAGSSDPLAQVGKVYTELDKPTAIELGVATADHVHQRRIFVGGDVNTYYPVLLNGNGLTIGVSIDRNIHEDFEWGGALALHLTGIGYGWGSNTPYHNYYFSQLWNGGAVYGCLADVVCSNATEGVYIWLRGGRTYDLTSPGYIETTIYLSGVTEPTGPQFMPKTEGPLYKLATLSTLGMTGGLYYGPPQDNKPYWNANNLPVLSGTWMPYFDDPTLSVTINGSAPVWKRNGDVYNISAWFTITGVGSLSGGRFKVKGLPFDFGSTTYRTVNVYESRMLAGTPYKGSTCTAGVLGSSVDFFYKNSTNGVTEAVLLEHIRPSANGVIEVVLNIVIAL